MSEIKKHNEADVLELKDGWKEVLLQKYGVTEEELRNTDPINLEVLKEEPPETWLIPPPPFQFRQELKQMVLDAGGPLALSIIDGICPRGPIEYLLACQVAIGTVISLKFASIDPNVRGAVEKTKVAITAGRLASDTLNKINRSRRPNTSIQKIIIERPSESQIAIVNGELKDKDKE